MAWKQLPFEELSHYMVSEQCEVVNTKIYPSPEKAKKVIMPSIRNNKCVLKLSTKDGKTVRVYPTDFLLELFPGLDLGSLVVTTKAGHFTLTGEEAAGDVTPKSAPAKTKKSDDTVSVADDLEIQEEKAPAPIASASPTDGAAYTCICCGGCGGARSSWW